MWRQVPEQSLEGTTWERNKKVKYKELKKKKKTVKMIKFKKSFFVMELSTIISLPVSINHLIVYGNHHFQLN